MAFSRGLGVMGLVTVSWLVAVGCSDDDKNTQQDAQAGEAGESAAGKSADGGKGGGGKGGTAGSGGTGGTTAGTAGDGGASGGEPPIVSGGAGAGGEPSGGAAGDGGAGGEPALGLAQCAYECGDDDDCLVGGAQVQKICDVDSKRCVDPSDGACKASAECFPIFNGWAECATTGECDEGFVCATWEGTGYCMSRNLDGCVAGDLDMTLPEFGIADSPVNVCMQSAACYLGACQPGCELIGCEGSGVGETCGQVTHLCECTEGTECDDSGVCGADHQCAECVTDQDCIDKNALGLDKCYAGKCGCAGALSCPDVTENATPVCE